MPNRARALLIAVAALALLLAAAAGANADTYTVTRTDDPNPGPCLPADCSLRQAVTASNDSPAVDDLILIPASASPYRLLYEELTLPVNDEVEIRGEGADRSVVEGDTKETLFTIAAVKTTLVGLTMTNGKGAIQNNGNLTLREVSIEDNERDIDSGGVKSNGPLRIESSFIGFNRSEAGTGGGVQSNGAVTIVNSTIAHNSSATGPGGIGANSSVTIVSSAVVHNRADSAGDVGAGASTLIVRDSVFADNRSASGLSNCASSDPLTSFGGNVSDDASCGAGATDRPNVNPLLGALALHGGTTQLYDLLADSPAIDAASQCPAADQRGVARPQGAACDSGPYEFVPVVASPPPAPAADTQLAMQLGKDKLFVDAKGRTKVRLTCPDSEVSPPCSGKVKLAGRFSAAANFKLAAGKTKAVALRLPSAAVTLLQENPKKRKVRVVVRAQDAAGNQQVIKQRRKLVPR